MCLSLLVFTQLLGSHTYSVRAFCFGRRVCLSVCLSICLSRVRSRKLGEIGAKFRHPYTKSGSESKNMKSDSAPEVVKYPPAKKNPNPQIAQIRNLDN